jgi:hypothetical protein
MALHVCVRGIGIRRSKDLRAEIGKCPNSTNERKNMSTKTLRKRIALVAVAALGTGVLSVAPASATAMANSLYVTTAANNPVHCSVVSTNGSEAIVLPLGVDFVITSTATNMEVNDTYRFAMPGTTVQTFGVQGVTNRTDVLSADRSTLSSTNTTAAANGPTTITFRAATAGSYVLTISERDASTTAAFADIEAISVSWVTTCANNVYSAADSLIQVRDDTSAAGTGTTVDEPTGLVRQNSETAYIALATEDAYGVALSGAGSLIASATNGAVINWDAAPSVQTSTAYLATRGATGTELYVTQGTANKDKPLTTVVTITLDGTVIGTKTIQFQGAASKIVVSDISVGKVGDSGSARGYWSAVVQDSAGNNLYQKTVAADSTANSAAGNATIASIAQSSISQDVTGLGAKPAAGLTTNNSQNGIYTCAASGTTTLFVQHVTNAVTGAAIKGSFTAACGGALDTWTISMDKASYAPGEIATLTVSGKDSKGFGVNSSDTLGTVEYSFGGLTAVTAPTSADKFDSAYGVKRYTLSVGTSEGSFVGTFKIAGATDTAAKTVQYKVAGPASTSNADVLKAIVSLIASINKQIAALQKALLRR